MQRVGETSRDYAWVVQKIWRHVGTAQLLVWLHEAIERADQPNSKNTPGGHLFKVRALWYTLHVFLKVLLQIVKANVTPNEKRMLFSRRKPFKN